MRRGLAVLLLLALTGCVGATTLRSDDFSRLTEHDVYGLTIKLPASMKRFDEGGTVAFRPDPPSRTSPGVLVLHRRGGDVDRILRQIYTKVENQMSGEPIYVRVVIAGREVKGVYAELVTHFVWIYLIKEGRDLWTLQMAAPLDWTDETALEFHDLICENVRIAPTAER